MKLILTLMFAYYQVPLGQLKCFMRRIKTKLSAYQFNFLFETSIVYKVALKSQSHFNGLLYSRQISNIRCIYLQQDLKLTKISLLLPSVLYLKNCDTTVWMLKSIASLIQWGQYIWHCIFYFQKYIIQSQSMKSLLFRYFK